MLSRSRFWSTVIVWMRWLAVWMSCRTLSQLAFTFSASCSFAFSDCGASFRLMK